MLYKEKYVVQQFTLLTAISELNQLTVSEMAMHCVL